MFTCPLGTGYFVLNAVYDGAMLNNLSFYSSADEFVDPKTFVKERSPFYIRMRYTVTKQGTKMKHSGYMVQKIGVNS